MISYKMGCSFEPDLLEGVQRLNEIDANVQISELYGSLKQHAFLAARPIFRLPEINDEHFESFVRKCNDIGIMFNYTFNTIYPGSKRFLYSQRNDLIDLVRYLEDVGVKMITVGNPLIAELIREASSTIKLEVSTVAHIDAITQVKVWKEKYSIEKICGNISKNRAIRFLENCAKYCLANDITLSLMVNEFCGNSGGTQENAYGTHCIFRDSCFLCHTGNDTIEDVNLLNEYPTRYCTSSKDEGSAWLKTRFIRPEDIDRYVNIGITHFKLAGRTGGTKHLLKVAEAYIRKSWEGNLLGLGKQIETVFAEGDKIIKQQRIYIENKKLEGFVDFWFKHIDFDCAEEVCGETCRYCNEYFDEKVRSK